MRLLAPRLLGLAWSTRLYLGVVVAAGLASAVVVVAWAGTLSHAIVAVFLGGADLAALQPFVSLLVGLVVARAALLWLGTLCAHLAAARVKSALRLRLARRLLDLGPIYLAAERRGELANALTRGVESLDPYVARYLPQLALAALVPPVLLAWIAATDPLSAVVLAATVPLLPLFMLLIGLEARRRTESQWRALSLMSAHFLDVLAGLTTLRVFGRSRAQVDVIRRVSDQYREATMRTLRVAFVSALVLEMVGTLGTALVAVAVGLRLVDGSLGLERGLAVLLLAPEVYLPLRQVGLHFHASMEGTTAASRIFEVLDGEPTPKSPIASAPSVSARLAEQPIRFEDVTLRYPGQRAPALAHVSFEWLPDECLAIVGPSGAGKTSLASLLLRFAAPTSGRMLLGQRDVASIDPEQWRSSVAWVPQRPCLVRGTVADNIRLAAPGADDARVHAAARLANCLDLVAGLPDGLDTVVGERGEGLSAGQRQRVALARAFLRDAPLLILDEPTAGLDAESADAIARTLQRLARGRRTLLITHHPALVRMASRVLRLDGGVLATPEMEPVGA